jgi:hypothetical protein
MNISYGFELELSDIDRSINIPEILGRWEGPKEEGYYRGAELDIVNTLGKFKGVASDPLCETCTVGGEINVSPSPSIVSQFCKIHDIINLFPVIGHGHVNHFHVHTYFEELEDLDALKQLIRYTLDNEQDLINSTYLQNWNDFNFSNISDWGRVYLLQDGGRYLNQAVGLYLESVNTRDELMDLLRRPGYYIENGSTHISTSMRTAVNFSNLVSNKTLEFRCFRSTLSYYEIISELLFVTDFITEGLKHNGKSVKQILADNKYRFAPLLFDEANQIGWEATRYEKGRGDAYKYYFKDGMPVTNFTSQPALRVYDKVVKEL